MTVLEFLLAFELILLACAALGTGLALIIYRQYPDEPFNLFFRLFWRKFFTWKVTDVTADVRPIIIKDAPIPLEGGGDDEEAAEELTRQEAPMKRPKTKSSAAPARGGQGVATLDLKVVPNASQNQIMGRLGEAIKIQVTNPPEDGDANRAVIQLLADVLGVKVYQITLVTGHYRPEKRVKIAGMDQSEVDAVMDQFA